MKSRKARDKLAFCEQHLADIWLRVEKVLESKEMFISIESHVML